MSKGAVRTLNILECFLETKDNFLGVSEVSRLLGLDKSTISRELHVLEERGWLFMEPTSRKYTLGPKTLLLSHRLLPAIDWPTLALDVMQSLRDATLETVSIQVKVGLYRICIFQLPGLHEVRRVIEEGQFLPLHAGSNGKAILAFISPSELEEFFQVVTLSKLTTHTITSPTVLREALLMVKERGYAIGVDERMTGVSGIAVPLFQGDEVVASLAITGPSSRLTMSRMEQHAQALLDGGRIISNRLAVSQNAGSSVGGLAKI